MAVAYVLLNFPIYEGRLDVVPPAATFARPSVTQSLGASKPKNNWKVIATYVSVGWSTPRYRTYRYDTLLRVFTTQPQPTQANNLMRLSFSSASLLESRDVCEIAFTCRFTLRARPPGS
jgi:hypothetical protein